MPHVRNRNLLLAGATWAAFLFASFDLYSVVVFYSHDWRAEDFTIYYAAAKVGLQHGWGSLYDLKLQRGSYGALRPDWLTGDSHTLDGPGIWYMNPPPLAWLVAPLTVLPLALAYFAWTVGEVMAITLAWRLAAPGSGWKRAFFLLGLAAFYPAVFAIQLGQPVPFVMLSVTAAWHLLDSRRPGLAGLALSGIALKPQLAILVPPSLLLLRQWRAVATWVISTSVLAAFAVYPLGANGLQHYVDMLRIAASIPFSRYLTAGWYLGRWSVAVDLLLLAVALAGAWRSRNDSARVFSIALLASALTAPYLHWGDLAMLMPAAWLAIRAGAGRVEKVLMLSTIVAIEFVWATSPLPWLLTGGAWLVVGCFGYALEPRARPAAKALHPSH